ncbi:MAG: hypothetical protein JSV32_08380 [Dehalococcoidia bacterium]|nr:MAG: hypothetical protein JSV32_08380 [Dehalococcoidia bacterium]
MSKRKWLIFMVVVGVLASILATTSVLAHDPKLTEEGLWAPGESRWDFQDRNRGWGMYGFHMGFLGDEAAGRFLGKVLEEGEYLLRLSRRNQSLAHAWFSFWDWWSCCN